MTNEPEAVARLDAENPWPGLLSFREDEEEFFGGRDDAIEALSRRVSTDQLTLVFGHSGLGKTSLLRAGLFPRLRAAYFFPVYIRLEFVSRRSVRVQIQDEIMKQAAEFDIEATPPRQDESLAAYLQRDDVDFWNDRNFPCKLVLVFDQFEELFTKGADFSAELVQELAPLTETSRSRARVVLTIREDYVGQLETLSHRFRSVFVNRFQVRRMFGEEALASVMKAGAKGDVIEEAVARRVIRFVGGIKDDPEEEPDPSERLPVEQLKIEPALLSVICSELNIARKETHANRITNAMLAARKQAILTTFYERSFEGVSPAMRRLVEDDLVMRDGKSRDSIAEQRALQKPGITSEDVEKLIARRVLRPLDVGDTRRLELTHDLLAPEAAASRARREEIERAERKLDEERRAHEQQIAEAEKSLQETKRALRTSRKVAAAIGMSFVMFAALIALLGYMYFASSKARKREAVQAYRSAMQAFDDQRPSEGLANLARSLDRDPDNETIRSMMTDRLLRDGWPVVVASYEGTRDMSRADLSPDGRRLVVAEDGRVQVWDLAPHRLVAELDLAVLTIQEVRFLPHSQYVFISGYSRSFLWNPAKKEEIMLDGIDVINHDGSEVAEPDPKLPVIHFTNLRTGATSDLTVPFWPNGLRYSPDGKHLLVAKHTDRGWRLTIVDRATGKLVGNLETVELVRAFTFTPDGRYLVIVDPRGGRVWSVATAKAVGEAMLSSGTSLEVSPDGSRVVMVGSETRLYAIPEGRLITTLRHDKPVTSAAFSDDSLRLVTSSEDETARCWRSSDGAPIGAPLVHSRAVSRAEFVDGGRSILTIADRVYRWELPIAADEPVMGAAMATNAIYASSGLLVFDEAGVLKIHGFDLSQGKPRWTVDGARAAPLALSAGGAFVCIGQFSDDRRRLRVHEGGGGRLLRVLDFPGENVKAADFTAKDEVLVVLTTVKKDQQQFHFLSTKTWTEVRKPLLLTGDERIVRAGGDFLAVRNEAGHFVIWNWRTGRRLAEIADLQLLLFSPDGTRLAMAGERNGLRVFENGQLMREVAEVDLKGVANVLTFSSDGRWLLASSAAQTILWDVAANRKHASIARGLDVDATSHFSADGKRVALTFGDDTVQVFDIAQFLPVTRPMQSDGEITVLSPDGNILYTARDETLVRADIASGSKSDVPTLVQLAEILAGRRIDENAPPVDIKDDLLALGRSCAEKSDRACMFVQWFRSTRSDVISPVSPLPIAEAIKRRLKWSSNAWTELATQYPGNPALGKKPEPPPELE
jgi:WD40 repeat protein